MHSRVNYGNNRQANINVTESPRTELKYYKYQNHNYENQLYRVYCRKRIFDLS